MQSLSFFFFFKEQSTNYSNHIWTTFTYITIMNTNLISQYFTKVHVSSLLIYTLFDWVDLYTFKYLYISWISCTKKECKNLIKSRENSKGSWNKILFRNFNSFQWYQINTFVSWITFLGENILLKVCLTLTKQKLLQLGMTGIKEDNDFLDKKALEYHWMCANYIFVWIIFCLITPPPQFSL